MSGQPHAGLSRHAIESRLETTLLPLREAERQTLSVALTGENVEVYAALFRGVAPAGLPESKLMSKPVQREFIERTAYYCLRATGRVDVSAVGQIVAWAGVTGQQFRTDRKRRQQVIVRVCRSFEERWWSDGPPRTVTGDLVFRDGYLTGYDEANLPD